MPNAVTAVRTVGAVTLGVLGAVHGEPGLLLAALAVYWAGDLADGWLARRMNQETRRGAAFDVLADRVCALAFWVPWAASHPETQPAVAVYLAEFVAVDGVLSLLWLRWPLLSCNYVGRVSRTVYLLNWWPPAKATNTAGLLLLLVVWPSPPAALAFAAAVLVLKAASLVLLWRRLPAPGPGCARRRASVESAVPAAIRTDAAGRVAAAEAPPP